MRESVRYEESGNARGRLVDVVYSFLRQWSFLSLIRLKIGREGELSIRDHQCVMVRDEIECVKI